MGGRGGSSGISSGGSVSALATKMEQLARYALPGHNYDEKKARQYYKVQAQFNKARQAASEKAEKAAKQQRAADKNKPKEHKTFVNSFGEATTRYITTQVYERHQRAVEDWFLGRKKRKK